MKKQGKIATFITLAGLAFVSVGVLAGSADKMRGGES